MGISPTPVPFTHLPPFTTRNNGRIPIYHIYPTLYITWLSWVVILITNAPISFLLGEKIVLPSLDMVWVWQLGYTVASMLAFWLIIEGLKYVEAGVGGLLGLLEIVFAVMIGIALFNEELSSKVLIGSALILIAASLPHLKELLKRNIYGH